MGNSMVTHNKYKSFMFFIRKYKVTELVPPQDLKEVFSKFTGGGSYVSAEQLHQFLVEHQAEKDLDDIFYFLRMDDFNNPLKAEICIVGVPADYAKKKTKVVIDNWFPVWDEEFEFPLTVPELALLRIQVIHKDQGKGDFGGQTCLPVSELKLGFRSVPLYNKKGEKFKSVKLLMQFQFE